MSEHCDVYRGSWMWGAAMDYLGTKPHDDDCDRIAWRTYFLVLGPHDDDECDVPAEHRRAYSEPGEPATWQRTFTLRAGSRNFPGPPS